MKKVVSKARRKTPPKAPSSKRAKDAIIERYGSLSFGPADDKRRKLIDWLEDNFVTAVNVFGSGLVQRKLCELKGINFESEYDDHND